MSLSVKRNRLFQYLILTTVSVLICLFGVFQTVFAEGSPRDDIQYAPVDNDTCLICHDNPKTDMTFANGDQISIKVDSEAYQNSVHAELACAVCHEGFDGVFHPELNIENQREYFNNYRTSCQQCHPSQFNEVEASIHEKLFEAGNQETPSCADCHDPHSQQDCKEGHHSIEDQMAILNICADCHQDVYDTYTDSIHGHELVVEKNVDMPTCVDCHSVHEICDPNEVAFRKGSIDMCANCHTDPKIMDKYGMPVNVLDTYLVFHDTTVTLLEDYDSEGSTNKPACYDCHGIHDVGDFSPPPIISEISGPDQYPAVETPPKPTPTQNVGITAAVLGLMLGGAGTMTISQIMKERKEEDGDGEDEEQGEQ
jgi:hypothetical protein